MNNKISILKSGSIYFFYRPKVRNEEEIQRFFFVLSSEENKYSSLIVGKKHLPENNHSSYFLFVEESNEKKKEFLNSLQRRYHQVGKGWTVDPEAHCLAEGKFIFAEHNGHTHLIYQIINPSHLKEIQQEFHLKQEDDYLIFVKNPEFGTMLNEREKVNYPNNLQEKFNNYKFIPLEPEFLNYKGTELLLISKKRNLVESEKNLQKCLEEIKQEDLSNEFSKVLSPESIFPF